MVKKYNVNMRYKSTQRKKDIIFIFLGVIKKGRKMQKKMTNQLGIGGIFQYFKIYSLGWKSVDFI